MRLIAVLLPAAAAFAPHSIVTNPTSAIMRNPYQDPQTALAMLPNQNFMEWSNSIIISASAESDVAFEDAFTDEVDLFNDPTIRLLLVGFGVFVVLAVVAKSLLNQMDAAIEKVLVEFETTMKSKYASRWVSIEAKLEGLEEPQRSQRLFEIMEGLQQSEPAFMEKVNRNMAGGYDGSQQ